MVTGVLTATAALTVTACGTGSGPDGSPGPGTSKSSLASHPAWAAAAAGHFQVKAAGCAPVAAAYDVTDAGTAAWAVQLPGGGAGRPGSTAVFQAATISPVTAGGLAVYAYGDVISARRLTDGQQAWQRVVTGPAGAAAGAAANQVGNLWTWHGELIALIAPVYLGQRPAGLRVLALSPATGAIRWTADLGTGDLYNDQVITSGGVLAVLTEGGGAGGRGKLIAVGLEAGTVLWSRPYGRDELTDGPTAAGPVIVMAEHGTVTGFDARTGAVRWTRAGLPGPVETLAVPGGGVLLYDLLQQALPGQRAVPASRLFPVTALDAASGAVRWRVRTAGPVSEVSAAGGVITIGTSGSGRLTLLTSGGRVLWSVPEHVANDMTWVNTGTDLVYIATGPTVNATGIEAGLTWLADRRLATGALRWSVRLPAYAAAQVVWPGGGNLIVTAESGSGARPAAISVDPATGRTGGGTSLASLVVTTPLTVAGGDTLIELTSAACPLASAPAAGGAAPGASGQ